MSEIDLNDGLTRFRCGDQAFAVDLVAWVRWYTEVSTAEPEQPYALLDQARAKLQAEHGVQLNQSQIDAFLHSVMIAYTDVKKKQLAERTSANSTASTPSS